MQRIGVLDFDQVRMWDIARMTENKGTTAEVDGDGKVIWIYKEVRK
jgi:mRNA-degrading endonuclease toxin of MazEF toxin-antitoxin module